ncbi:bifunctional phosphoglucose/phosphomannose isomerase, partial [bacterium]|nr:bifunctional phosphoglucose/phosphomannose isomerase [bacterium]
MDRILDDPATIEKCDPTGMIRWIENFHEQCAEGVSIARAFDLPDMQGIQNVVVCGMGGSAIGGDLMRSYASSHALAPIEVVRSYQLPRYAN